MTTRVRDPHTNNSEVNEGNAWINVAVEVGKIAVLGCLTYYTTTKLLHVLQDAVANVGDAKQEKAIESTKKRLAERLKKPELAVMSMNSYEAKIASDVISSEEIGTSFQDIGGLESEIEEVMDHVILPLQMWKMFKGKGNLPLFPTGVLLYGKPGTGKTMTAKAIAKEAGATFISIKASTVMDKWFGESDKLVTALFSLSRKLAPSILFIDEIDTLLKNRSSSNNNPAMHSMQGVFLSEWDGLNSNMKSEVDDEAASSSGSSNNAQTAPVVVLGATNRPMDLDSAFLRRMPVSVKLPIPDFNGRRDILLRMLRKENLAADVDFGELALRTEGFTGSDLRGACR
jgi:SpoVK/Ycf46/Vps4 family AAA+-type ATPase